MKYIVGGAKSVNSFYYGNKRYYLYLVVLVSFLPINYYFFGDELLKLFIKDVIFYGIFFGLLEFVFQPKSLYYMEFQSDSVELGFNRKKSNKTIAHSNIESIDTTVSDVVIKTKDGKTYEVPLSHFHYDEVRGIKDDVFQLQEKLTHSIDLLATE